jgi:predicted small lipoprotein YifL
MLSFWTRLLALSLLLAQLSACGLKGDLYIPERQYPQPQPQPKTPAQ